MAQRSVGGAGSGGSGAARRIEVDPERIVRWVNGFAERHGDLTWSSAESSVTVSAADGATAALDPFASGVAGGADDLDGLAAWAVPPQAIALILVRRGGYAVGLGSGAELIAHKVGTRYVQSRTAAGGWSQHRFARRRDNQADALVVSVIEHAQRVVLAPPTGARVVRGNTSLVRDSRASAAGALVVGGDKTLVREVLADPRLARLVTLPRRELFDLPDPRLVVLKQALRRGRAVRITLSEPAPGPMPG